MIEIRDLLGKRYLHGGRGPDAYDCAGVFLEVQRRGGRVFPDYLRVAILPEEEELLISETKAAIKAVKVEKPNELDAIVFYVSGRPRHVGVYLENGLFIHCWFPGVMISELSTWKKKVEGYYTWPQ